MSDLSNVSHTGDGGGRGASDKTKQMSNEKAGSSARESNEPIEGPFEKRESPHSSRTQTKPEGTRSALVHLELQGFTLNCFTIPCLPLVVVEIRTWNRRTRETQESGYCRVIKRGLVPESAREGRLGQNMPFELHSFQKAYRPI